MEAHTISERHIPINRFGELKYSDVYSKQAYKIMLIESAETILFTAYRGLRTRCPRSARNRRFCYRFYALVTSALHAFTRSHLSNAGSPTGRLREFVNNTAQSGKH